MELQRMIARFVAEPAPFTQQALYLARRSILDTMGAMIAGSVKTGTSLFTLASIVQGKKKPLT